MVPHLYDSGQESMTIRVATMKLIYMILALFISRARD